MAKYIVYGSVSVHVAMTVEADSIDEALGIANYTFEPLSNFCGNGGSDKLVGTTQENVSLESGENYQFDSAEITI